MDMVLESAGYFSVGLLIDDVLLELRHLINAPLHFKHCPMKTYGERMRNHACLTSAFCLLSDGIDATFPSGKVSPASIDRRDATDYYYLPLTLPLILLL